MKVSICKAEPLGNNSVPDTIIEITDKLPEFVSMEDAEKFYQNQAAAIVDALFNSIPQGTRWRVLAELMKVQSETMLYKGR